MTHREAFLKFGQTAQKWRDLADQRRAAFTDLYESGRWKKYYTEDELLLRMREVVGTAETWTEVASRFPNEPSVMRESAEQAPIPLQRSAA
jgi:uncharacterized repeat protein (TIGR03809 family)